MISLFDGEVNQFHAGMWRFRAKVPFLRALLTGQSDGRSDSTGVSGSRQCNLGCRVESRRWRAGMTCRSLRDAILQTDPISPV